MTELGCIIGFTGSRSGMSDQQKESFLQVVKDLEKISTFRHGDCIGSDADAHKIMKNRNCHIIGHPPSYKKYRAFCDCDIFLNSKAYLDRNKDIVNSSEILIATPAGIEKLRSGTWSTVRYARKKARPIYIIMPNGKIKEENIENINSEVDSD